MIRKPSTTNTKLESTGPPAVALPSKMTYEEFLYSWEKNPFNHAEWVDGEAIELAPPDTRHQRLVAFLHLILNSFLEAHPLGEVFLVPCQMKTGPSLPGREPDLLFVSAEHADRVKEEFVDGPADLAIEIVSPNRPARDYNDKFGEYQRGGVREYWVIDPVQGKADFYFLNPSGRYESISIGDDQTVRSHVLGSFWLKVDWLFQKPLPSRLEILRQWGNI